MFNKLFSTENPVWRAMDKMSDLMILNFYFIIFSLPIFTIGASMTALYTVTFKMLDETEGNLFKNFFKAFKNNFKQATVIWLLVLAAGIFLVSDFMMAYTSTNFFMKIFMVVVGIVAIVYAMFVSWVFPLQCRFQNTIKATVKNALLMMVIHMFPTTLLITLLNVVPLLVLWFQTALFFWLLPIVVFILFALIAYNNSKQLKKVFDEYIPDDQKPVNPMDEY